MLSTREWAPRSGQTRLYVQNLADLIGLDVDYYKSGNISSAALDGQAISNAEAGRILAAKVWIGVADGQVRVDGFTANSITAQEISEAVRAARVANA
ncbi:MULTISPECIES: hypothetical protein [unclassified Mycolicibacterium]|uniref:Uncharacterized protein n=1 Tax=Mycolicibacterium sp. CBMA 213 TaxID=1968788 RepID=A0A343VR79_9MYCO|nr:MULTISPECIES: hypothetical protein [unclassified Mycolicibacterium]AVN58403.1 hypothetical protein B5P44_p00108 [Mycolicibacterium sp. CBMA 213]MUL61063.1 hypothetical protein [Mycolicibacterium sp. CBMA 335]